MKNIMVAQSGGPTTQINSTLYGVIMEALNQGAEKIYGARFGISGLLKKNVFNLLSGRDFDDFSLLLQTPACALSSCRKRLKPFKEQEEDYLKIVELFKELKIDCFIYIGGNDSMDTANKIFEYFKAINFNVSVIGAPKTIDNDLQETDHCPGFGSAAKYVATTFLELERDISIYSIPAVTLVEVMGRDAGWLTASCCLSKLNGGRGPSLVYCCESAFDFDNFFNDVSEKLKENSVLIALSEGIKTADGKMVSSLAENRNLADEFGHLRNSGACRVLEGFVKENFGCKTRAVELSLMQRCAAHVASLTDLKESVAVGKEAVKLANCGRSGVMVAIRRLSNNPYLVEYEAVELNKVANKVKLMPKSFILESGNNLADEAEIYFKPLIEGEPEIKYRNGLPVHFKFN